MGLSDYRPPRKAVEFPGGEVSVRGLSTGDIATLRYRNPDSSNRVFRAVLDATDSGEGDSGLIDVLLNDAFVLVSECIALVSDEGDIGNAHHVRDLPFGVLTDIVSAIIEMTTRNEGGVEKLKGLFIQMARGVNEEGTEALGGEPPRP